MGKGSEGNVVVEKLRKGVDNVAVRADLPGPEILDWAISCDDLVRRSSPTRTGSPQPDV
jgi:hypothetical protein